MSFVSEILLLLAHILFLVFFFLLSFGVGYPLLRKLRLNGGNLLLISLSCGVGAWFLSQLVMALGIAGLLTKKVLFALLSVLFLFSLFSIRKWGEPLKRLRIQRPTSLSEKGILLFCLLYFGACILGLSSPDLSYDSLKYHLYFPRLYLESGQVQFLPHNMLSAFPQNMEMLYLIGLGLGEGFARVVNIFFTLLCLLLLGSLAKEISGRKHTGLFAVLSFLMFPAVFYGTVQAYVDIGSSFYGAGSLLCLLRGHAERNKKWFFLAGLLSAAGFGIKYLYFIHLATLNFFLMCLWISAPRQRRYSLIRSVLIFTGTAVLLGSSWYLRNYLVTKNPTYPLFYSVFGGPYWSRELENGLLAVRKQFGPPKTLVNFILLPLFLLKEENYLLFAFIPLFLVFIRDKKFKETWPIAGLCVMEMAVWFFLLTFQMRYGMFWHLLLAILFGIVLESVLKEGNSFGFRRVTAFFLISLAVVSLRVPLATAAHSLPILLGFNTKEALQFRYVESYAIMKYVNETLPKEAKIASFGDSRGYYCKRPFYPIHPDISGYIDLNQTRDVDTYYKRLQEIGITHLIYNPRRTEIFRNRYPRWIALQKGLEERYLEKIRKENGVSLYKLKLN